MTLKYYVLDTTERYGQKVPFGIRGDGKLVRLAGCPIEHMATNENGRYYLAKLNEDPAHKRDPSENRQVVIRLSPVVSNPSVYRGFDDTFTPIAPRIRLKKITREKYNEVHSQRHLRIAVKFAMAGRRSFSRS